MMRPSIVLCLLLLATCSFSQTIRLSSGKSGVSVSKVQRNSTDTSVNKPFRLAGDNDIDGARWRFKEGDSAIWARPDYVDRHWVKTMKPKEALQGNKALWNSGKGWYRLLIKADKEITKSPVNLLVNQFGRSELYLDGRLLTKMVPFRFDSGGSQRIMQLVALPIADTNQHVLAIRYAFRKEPTFFAELGEPPMKLSVIEASEGLTSYYFSESFGIGIDFLCAGIFSTLSLLHFLFFRANRAQRINRTLFWTMLAFAIAFLTDFLSDVTPSLTIDSLVELGGKLGFRLGCALLLWGVYQYLKIQAGWFFHTIVALLAIDLVYRALIGPVPDYTDGIGVLLSFIDYIRLSWVGRKRKVADARLPWKSLKLAILCIGGVFIVAVIGVIASKTKLLNVDFDLVLAPIFVLFFIAMLSIPVGLSLSLVQDYTRTYRSLENNLREVEQLSARTVAQEQEKQQILARQNETLEHLVTERTAALDQSLTELKATQDQLIQREKLASLGELTAGVAHEIQNPLNFVNNFSEVSVELLTELEEEQEKPVDERDVDLEKEILGDIKQNIGKISHHGQRAASIVRGMLQHSRTSTGQREPTDLNALTDEYLRLAYHGIRAKEKNFDVSLVTHFDPDLPAVPTVSQDIGRVLMNLFTNAFYAVQERTQRGAASESGTYKPTVTVTTARVGDKVQIRVHDNGTGIPDEVRSKIFQPFFTTKPTGMGTGLGLSLSYDIITKGHGGTIGLETKPVESTEFVITLPM